MPATFSMLWTNATIPMFLCKNYFTFAPRGRFSAIVANDSLPSSGQNHPLGQLAS